MTKSRTQLMVERLRELQASSPDIEASAIVSVDGLTIASALPQGIEEDRVSAMSAAMLSLGERIASELGRGSLEQVYIKGLTGYVVLMSVGEDAVLTALAREHAKLGLIFLDMRRATEDLTQTYLISGKNCMEPIPKSGLYYPYKFARIAILALEGCDGGQWGQCDP